MSSNNNNGLIAWCQKTPSGAKITITDSKKYALKLFNHTETDTSKLSGLQGAIYYGVIEKTNINGTFIKAGEQNLYARARKTDRIGKTELWQIQKSGDRHKLPRCRRHFRLENYYFSYHQQMKNDATINNEALQKARKTFISSYPTADILQLKQTGIATDVTQLKPHADSLLAQIETLTTGQHHKGLVKPPPSMLQQALTYPITSIIANDNISKLYVNHQLNNLLNNLPINIAIDDEAEHIIAQAGAICADDIINTQKATLVYQQTQTCHLIDINSAHSNQPPKQLNLALLKDLWQLIYLKNLSGIIVIDFISMSNKNDRQMLHDALIKQVKQLAALLQKPAPMIHGWTRAGLYEITISE
ncbi:MAG: ribonuclease E/G [Alphaproteobacteria bacterium]|nr:ribonuclease E/G [Alphaproteobacteria bacterium]